MARKDRAPTPPKRPQGPQRRSTPSAGRNPESARRLLYLAAGAAILAAAVAGFLLLRGDVQGGGGPPEALREAGCTYREFPAQPAEHTDDLTEKIEWNSSPPTNGKHYQAPAIWGAYDEPLQLIQVVHNLEHGGVYVLYGDGVDDATVERLQGFYDDDPTGMLLAPLPSLGKRIALGVWTAPEDDPAGGTGRLALCPSFDEDAFRAFRDEYRFTGPERFPPEALQPGS